MLIDSNIRKFPIVKLQVDTPYFVGEVEAMCMENPICNLVIGNLPGAGGAKSTKVTEHEPAAQGNTDQEQGQAVVTIGPTLRRLSSTCSH